MVKFLDSLTACFLAAPFVCYYLKPRLHTRRKPANCDGECYSCEWLGCYTLAAFLFVLSQLFGIRLARASSSGVDSQSGDRDSQSASYSQIHVSKFNMLCELQIVESELQIVESASLSTRASR